MASETLPPSLQAYDPSQPEKQVYNWLFQQADKEQLGVLTGDLAVPFFSHSSLSPLLLGQIWQLADPENAGFLSPDRFGLACRLIAHAQAERAQEVQQAWIAKAAPLPTFSHLTIPAHLASRVKSQPSQSSQFQPPSSPPPASAPPSRLTAQPTGQQTVDLTVVKPEDKVKYGRVFAGANGGVLTGLLDGDKARDIFIKSNLPYEVLGQIWNLADTHSRGSLDLTDFTIGMHLLHLLMDGSITPAQLPQVLDPKLYAAAAGLPAPGTQAQGQAPLQAQGPGQAQGQRQPPSRQASIQQPSSHPQQQRQQQQQGGSWAINPQEQAESDQWFDSLDAQKKGRLEGEQAVGFFGQSGLEVEKLAKVWDLSDLTNVGYLTKETFAIAMHLLKSAVSNPSNPLPDTLPSSLVPPSLRSPSGATPPVISQPQRDLLDLMGDDDTPSSPAPTLQPQPTGSRLPPLPLSPQGTGQVVPAGTARAISPALSPQATGSSFTGLRGTVFPQATGGSATGGFGNNFQPSASASPAPPLPIQPPQHTSSTFFDDNDDADLASSSQALEAQASSLRAEESQLSSRAQQTGRTREDLEKSVEALNSEISALQARVASAREAHESESTRVDELRTREGEQKSLLARARHDLIAAESDLSALRLSKSELEGELLRDKEDWRELQRRVSHVEAEKKALQEEVEKVKKEVRQGKGRGAIARKQLAAAETARDGAEKELAQVQAGDHGLEEEAMDHLPQQAAASAAQVPLPMSPAGVVSPAGSTRSTNPFDRLTALSPQGTGGSTSAQSTNPFAFASSSPTSYAPSPAPPAPQPQSREVTEQSDHEPSLPVAAAAAVGTGALAALGATGTVVAGALGLGEEKGEEPKQEEEQNETDPFGVRATAKEVGTEGFGDDFSSSTAGTATQGDAAAFHDAFSDFPSSTAQDANAGTAPPSDSAAFDDAFSSFAPPPSIADNAKTEAASSEETVEGKLGDVGAQDGVDDAFRDLTAANASDAREGKDAVVGTLGEMGAGFDEAFDEVAAHSGDKGKGREIEPESPTPDEEDSSEDEAEEPEDVFSSAHASRFARSRSPSPSPSLPVPSPAGATELKTREPTQGSSESGESFVHVSASSLLPHTPTSASSPASGAAGAFDPVVGPGGTAESKDMLEAPAPASFEPASPAPESEVEVEAKEEEKKEKRRAAPPPPPQRTASSTASTKTASAPSISSVPPTVPAPTFSAEDDFDSAFADMGPSSSSSFPASSESPSVASFPPASQDDDAFEFKPDFGDSLPNVTSSTGGDGLDDAAFADFDSSFPAVPTTSASAIAPIQDGTAAAAFDDAFSSFDAPSAVSSTTASTDAYGAPVLGAPVSSSSFPSADTAVDQAERTVSPLPPTPRDEQAELSGAAAPAGVTPGDDGDSDAVKQIKAMGFSREQAVEALEKYDYDLNRAVNSLVS
ncbi:hypothetical protein JCM11641_001677 [Rhodosporidiobolus odoratus]